MSNSNIPVSTESNIVPEYYQQLGDGHQLSDDEIDRLLVDSTDWLSEDDIAWLRVVMPSDSQVLRCIMPSSISERVTDSFVVNDSSVSVKFYREKVQIPNSCDQDGAFYDHENPVFKEFDLVRISGSYWETLQEAGPVVHQYVNDSHIKRWPDLWKAYKSGQESSNLLSD